MGVTLPFTLARAFRELGRTIGGAVVVGPSRFLHTQTIHRLCPTRTVGVGEHKKNGGGRPSHLCALPPLRTAPRLRALPWRASFPLCERLLPPLAHLCGCHESPAAAATLPLLSLVSGTTSPWYSHVDQLARQGVTGM